MRPGRLRAVLPAALVTVSTAVGLGGAVSAALALAADEPWASASFLRTWAIASAVSLPLGFVFGVPLLAVVRSVRRRRPTLGPEAGRDRHGGSASEP